MPLRPDPESQAVSAYKPASHRNDPETSREAASMKAESGTLETDRAEALDLVRRFPGNSVKELIMLRSYVHGRQADCERERQRIGRRMSELAKAGKIHARGTRDGCQLWHPGPAPKAARQGALFEVPAKWRTD